MRFCMNTTLDWSRMDFDWNHVRAFLVTADTGSYTAAARALQVAQPTIGRQVAALEDELGVILFERAGRGVALTPTGLELIEHVRAMSEAALRVSRVAAGQSLSLEGPVCLTASEVDATHFLPPVVRRLRAEHPGIEIEIVASNAPQDLRRREADVALRSFRPTEPDLVARKLRDGEAHLYATPAYLRTLGRKITRERLANATFVGFDRTDAYRRGLAAIGLEIPAERFAILSASSHVQWAMVRAGLCVGITITEVGDADPTVVRALPELPAIPVPLWLVTHRDVHTSRRVRAVADVIVSELGHEGSSKRRRRPSR
jgi:DNA-binding transcriptional LysR family regulator